MAIFKELLEHSGNLNIGNWDNEEGNRIEETKKKRRGINKVIICCYFLHLFSASCIAEILISRSFLLRHLRSR